MLFGGIQVSEQNSETNWRQYSDERFGLSLAKNWILIFLPSYVIFHYLQTVVSDIAIFVLKRDVKLQLTN